jgi:Domain of unknown function in PX-proteins (DUF3818)
MTSSGPLRQLKSVCHVEVAMCYLCSHIFITVSQEDPQQTVQIFINLIERHEQSFYFFVHKVHSKGEGLFTGLMRWTELFLDVIREGLGEPISLEFIFPHNDDERREIMKEIDEVALYHYKLKVAYESKLRRRFGRAGGGADKDGDDETTRDIVNGFVRDVSFGDLMRGDMLEVAAEEEEESSDSYESSSEFESATDGDESESEESTQRPSLQNTGTSAPQRRAQDIVPSSQPKLAFPLPTKSSSPAPTVASPSSAGSRLRKLSLTLRRSKSMTLDPSRSTPSNNMEKPPPLPSLPAPPPAPPVPPLPPSVTKSRSTAPLTAERINSKPLPAPPPLSSPSSPSAIRAPVRRTTAPSAPQPLNASTTQKRNPTNQTRKSSQAPTKGQGKQAASEALKPPQLKKIPELLPIFVEMVRCHNSNPFLFPPFLLI